MFILKEWRQNIKNMSKFVESNTNKKEEYINNFVRIMIESCEAYNNEDYNTFKKLYNGSFYKLMKKNENEDYYSEALLVLMQHNHPNVRLGAATQSLMHGINIKDAKKTLKKIKKDKKLGMESIFAEISLDKYKAGYYEKL